jgi:surface protein
VNSGTLYYYTDAKTIYLSGDASGMFNYWNYLETLDMASWNTTNLTNMDSMFRGCKKLTTLDLSNFDTSNVTNMN